MDINPGHDNLGFLLSSLWKEDRKFVSAQPRSNIRTPQLAF